MTDGHVIWLVEVTLLLSKASNRVLSNHCWKVSSTIPFYSFLVLMALEQVWLKPLALMLLWVLLPRVPHFRVQMGSSVTIVAMQHLAVLLLVAAILDFLICQITSNLCLIEGQRFDVFRYFLPNALWVVLQGLVSSCFFMRHHCYWLYHECVYLLLISFTFSVRME
jgi:hypothetical protein